MEGNVDVAGRERGRRTTKKNHWTTRESMGDANYGFPGSRRVPDKGLLCRAGTRLECVLEVNRPGVRLYDLGRGQE